MTSCSDADSQQTKCACFKLGQTCTRLCPLFDQRIGNNPAAAERKFQPKTNRKSCMYIATEETLIPFIFHIFFTMQEYEKQTEIKMSTKIILICGYLLYPCMRPCSRDNLECTSDCRWRNCGNIYDSGDDVPSKRSAEEVPVKIKRRRNNPQVSVVL